MRKVIGTIQPGKASVRGPFGRWLLVGGGDNGMGDPIKFPTPVSSLTDDAKYASAAMNGAPDLARAVIDQDKELEALREENIRMMEALVEVEKAKDVVIEAALVQIERQPLHTLGSLLNVVDALAEAKRKAGRE